MHYFANDFDQIKRKIQENISEDHTKNRKDEYGRKPIGDFVPHKIAQRLKETIDFSVKMDLRSTDIEFDVDTLIKMKNSHDEGVDFFRSGNYDYESISVLREHKIQCLEKILKSNVNRKYKISFFKGMQLMLEAMIMFLLMASMAVKANVYSLIYLMFIFKFVVTKNKTQLLIRINVYMCILFFI
jgi:hypothetical protein